MLSYKMLKVLSLVNVRCLTLCCLMELFLLKQGVTLMIAFILGVVTMPSFSLEIDSRAFIYGLPRMHFCWKNYLKNYHCFSNIQVPTTHNKCINEVLQTYINKKWHFIETYNLCLLEGPHLGLARRHGLGSVW